VEEASRIMSAQRDAEESTTMAHHVIRNEGSLAELERRALDLLSELRTRIQGEQE
jgi:dephospho-CoA kinase